MSSFTAGINKQALINRYSIVVLWSRLIRPFTLLWYLVTYNPTMPGSKVLVLGGTGPAGICLLRELIHRNHEVIAFARDPTKIPEDVSSNPLIEVSLPRYPGFKCAHANPSPR